MDGQVMNAQLPEINGTAAGYILQMELPNWSNCSPFYRRTGLEAIFSYYSFFEVAEEFIHSVGIEMVNQDSIGI